MLLFKVVQEDVLGALKKFKRLAKQDILASEATSNPGFWRSHAETRLGQYEQLMKWIEEQGIEPAYRQAVLLYQRIPILARPTVHTHPELSGQEQALEMFFAILGVGEDEVQRRQERRAANHDGELAVMAGS